MHLDLRVRDLDIAVADVAADGGGEVEILADDSGAPPWLAKTAAPLERPEPTMALIDADMIVTRPLGAGDHHVGHVERLADVAERRHLVEGADVG